MTFTPSVVSIGVRRKVLLVIPACNEEQRLEAPLRCYVQYARGLQYYEVRFLVVLNGCRDGTAALVARLCGEFPELSSLEYKEPIGKGGALLAGFRQARDAEWVGFTDADGATPPDSLFGLLAGPVADVMVGKRDMSTRPFGRRLASFCFNSLVRLLLGLRTQDAQCGAKFFRAAFLPRILAQTDTCDMAVDVDLLLAARATGAVMQERSVSWSDQPGSKVRALHTSALMFLSVCRLWFLRRCPCLVSRCLLKINEACYTLIAGQSRRGLPGAPDSQSPHFLSA